MLAWGRALRRCLLRSRNARELLTGLCDLGIATLGADGAEAWRFDRSTRSLRRMRSARDPSAGAGPLSAVPLDAAGWRRLLMAGGGAFRSHEAWRACCLGASHPAAEAEAPPTTPPNREACLVGCPVGSWRQPLGWITWRYEDGDAVPAAMADLVAEIAAWTPVILGLRRTVRITRRRVSFTRAERFTVLSARGLVHDLDNALLPLRCRIEVLDSQVQAMAAKHTLSGVAAGLDHLQELAADLRNRLDGAASASGDAALRLGEWWRSARSAVEAILPASQSLRLHLPSNLAVAAVRDVRLTQAVGNLVSNAAKAASRGGSIAIVATAVGRRWIELRVEDDGPGIASDSKATPDGHAASTRNGGGVGLGLAIVRSVAEECGGDFRIGPRPGGGTVATLRLPRADRTPCRNPRGGARR